MNKNKLFCCDIFFIKKIQPFHFHLQANSLKKKKHSNPIKCSRSVNLSVKNKNIYLCIIYDLYLFYMVETKIVHKKFKEIKTKF